MIGIDDITGALGIQGSTDLTTFKVKAGGLNLTEVITLSIDYVMNGIPVAHILLSDGNVSNQEFALSEKASLEPGKEIEISLGYHNLETTVFKGIIVRQNIKVSKTGGSSLELICKDKVYRMSMGVRSRYFKDVKDSDVFDELCGDYDGVSASVKLGMGAFTSPKYKELIQHDISDWDFLVSRVEQSGMFLSVSDGEIKIQAAPVIALPDITATYGSDIIDLDVELNSEQHYEEYKALAWDDERLEIVEEDAGNTNAPDPGNVSHSALGKVGKSEFTIRHGGLIKTEQLKTWATAKRFRSEMGKLRGTITFQGTPKAKVGATIKLKGLGKRFEGTTIITGVNHQLIEGNWITTVQVGVDKNWHFENFKMGAQSEKWSGTRISGLQSGIVKQVHQDPDGRERILVNLPLIDPDDEGSWMRWASLDASESKGFACRPDIDDEVIVGFINGDSNQGVVLGSLYSKTRPGSELLKAEEGNYKKGWVLKENLHLIFDLENDNMELITPAGNSIKVSDEEKKITITDANQNEVVLDDQGISFTTQKDFVISAQGDVKIEGMNIELTAQTGFKAAGTTAEINGSGQTTIKGNPININ